MQQALNNNSQVACFVWHALRRHFCIGVNSSTTFRSCFDTGDWNQRFLLAFGASFICDWLAPGSALRCQSSEQRTSTCNYSPGGGEAHLATNWTLTGSLRTPGRLPMLCQ